MMIGWVVLDGCLAALICHCVRIGSHTDGQSGSEWLMRRFDPPLCEDWLTQCPFRLRRIVDLAGSPVIV